MIRPVSFVDTRQVSARFVLKYDQHLKDGVLPLRDVREDGIVDLPILEEWKSAKALLTRIRLGASEALSGKPVELGRAWIEQLPGGCGTLWSLDEDEYAQQHIRTRTCLIPAPDCYTYSGAERVVLGVGVVNVVEHRILNSETNFSAYPRVHLIVDVRRPEPDAT